jgi:hypothetical protein
MLRTSSGGHEALKATAQVEALTCFISATISSTKMLDSLAKAGKKTHI